VKNKYLIISIGLCVIFVVCYFLFITNSPSKEPLENWEKETLALTEQWAAEEKQNYAYQKKQVSKSGSSQEVITENSSIQTSSPRYASASSPQEKQEGTLSVKVESGGVLISIELDRYVVKIKKTKNLNGDYAYGMEEEKNGSGTFWGEPATFYYKNYGYYEVECAGYNKYSEEVFRIKYGNIKHACSSTEITMYADGTQPYVYCPLGE